MALELLLLIRTQPKREWSADELARELRAASEWSEHECTHLAERKLIATIGGTPTKFRYGPAQPELEEAVNWLATAYPERRFSIIQVIFSAPSEPIQSFADAFKLRKDKSNG